MFLCETWIAVFLFAISIPFYKSHLFVQGHSENGLKKALSRGSNSSSWHSREDEIILWMMSPVTSLPAVCYSVTIENVMMCYLLTQADATTQTTQTETHKRLVLPLVNVALHNCDVCSVSSPMISTDNEDLLSDPTLCSHMCVCFCVIDMC